MTFSTDPHCYGKAECFDCGESWTAVWPLGADALECPACGSFSTDRTATEPDEENNEIS